MAGQGKRSSQRRPQSPSAAGGNRRRRWGWKTALATVIVPVLLLVVAAVLNPLSERFIAPHEPEASPTTESATLVINKQWPPEVDLSCDRDVNVAGPPGSRGPVDNIAMPTRGEFDPWVEPRTLAVRSIGAITWYRGELRVALSTATAESAYIVRLEPVIFERSKITPAWGLEVQPPCGGPVVY